MKSAEELLFEAQDLLARYLTPGNGITDKECIDQLLGQLDGPDANRIAQEAGRLPQSGQVLPFRRPTE